MKRMSKREVALIDLDGLVKEEARYRKVMGDRRYEKRLKKAREDSQTHQLGQEK